MKRPAASLAFGETYGAKMPTEENKGEKKKPPVVDDLTMMYRFAPMQKKGSSAILRYDEHGKKQVCQVSGFNNLLHNSFCFIWFYFYVEY